MSVDEDSKNTIRRLTFPGALEKEPDHQNLQTSHTNHHAHFDHTEVEDSLLRTPDCAEIAVLSCPEVFLHSADCA